MDRAPCGIAVFDVSLRYSYINPALATINGRPVVDHLGRHPLDVDGSEGTRRWVRLAEAVLGTGETVGPVRFTRGRSWPVLEITFHPLITDGAVSGVVGLVWDVTATAETERREQILLRATAALARTSTVEEIASVVVTNVVTFLADRSAFGVVEGDELVIVDVDGYPEASADQVRGQRIGLDSRHPGAEAVRSDAPVIVDRAAFDARYPRHAALRALAGDEVVAVAPISGGGAVLGVVMAGWSSPAGGRRADVETIEALATVTNGATRRVRLAQAVADDQFRRALNASGDTITITKAVRDPATGAITDFVIAYANDNRLDAYGRTLSHLVGRSILASYPAVREEGLFDRLVAVVETGEPFMALEHPYHDLSVDPPVETWHELHVVAFDDGYLVSSRNVTAAVKLRRELDEVRIAAASERQAAQILRRAGLQTALPNHSRYEVAASYQPFHETAPIGGDWYDVFALDADRVGVIVGDVAGHGQDAAVSMIEMRSLLGSAARSGKRPDEVLRAVREAQFRHDTMTTCIYAIVDHWSGTITAASAGHPPPLVYPASGAARYLEVQPQPPLGLALEVRDETAAESLQPGTTVVFFTDGLIERPTENIDVGLARLREAVRPHLSPREQCDLLTTSFGDPDSLDDYCIVVLRLKP